MTIRHNKKDQETWKLLAGGGGPRERANRSRRLRKVAAVNNQLFAQWPSWGGSEFYVMFMVCFGMVGAASHAALDAPCDFLPKRNSTEC